MSDTDDTDDEYPRNKRKQSRNKLKKAYRWSVNLAHRLPRPNVRPVTDLPAEDQPQTWPRRPPAATVTQVQATATDRPAPQQVASEPATDTQVQATAAAAAAAPVSAPRGAWVWQQGLEAEERSCLRSLLEHESPVKLQVLLGRPQALGYVVWNQPLHPTWQVCFSAHMGYSWFEKAAVTVGLGAIDPSELFSVYTNLPAEPTASEQPVERLKAACRAAGCSLLCAAVCEEATLQGILCAAAAGQTELLHPVALEEVVRMYCAYCGCLIPESPLLFPGCHCILHCSAECQERHCEAGLRQRDLAAYQPSIVHQNWDSAAILQDMHVRLRELQHISDSMAKQVSQVADTALRQAVGREPNDLASRMLLKWTQRGPPWWHMGVSVLWDVAQVVGWDLTQCEEYLAEWRQVCRVGAFHRDISEHLQPWHALFLVVQRVLRSPLAYVIDRASLLQVVFAACTEVGSPLTPLLTLFGAMCAGGCGGQGQKQCSRCLKVVYCGRECQAAHWRSMHKRHCQRLKAVAVSPVKPTRRAVRPGVGGWEGAGEEVSSSEIGETGMTQQEAANLASGLHVGSQAAVGGQAGCSWQAGGDESGMSAEYVGHTAAGGSGQNAELLVQQDVSGGVPGCSAGPSRAVCSAVEEAKPAVPAIPPEVYAKACQQMLDENEAVRLIADVVLPNGVVEVAEDEHMLGLQMLLMVACLLDEKDMDPVLKVAGLKEEDTSSGA